MAVEEEKEQEEILEILHVKPKKIHVINEFLFNLNYIKFKFRS
ncbi:MAG: hypothetical protein ACTSPT_09965 [Candidatus Heimdallarchaeota archaeon]